MSKMKISYINDLKNLLRRDYFASFNYTTKNAFLGGGEYKFYTSDLIVQQPLSRGSWNFGILFLNGDVVAVSHIFSSP